MVYIPKGFNAPPVPELDDAEKNLDLNNLAGKSLPGRCTIASVTVHGASYSALSHRVEAMLADGTKKTLDSEWTAGKDMAKGEYEGLKALHAVIPANTPEPIAYGTYARDPSRHFLLCSFHEMKDVMPSTEKIISVVAELHEKSISHRGKFGFHYTTHAGNHPLQTTWCDSWENFFSRQFREEVKWEKSFQGQNGEMDELVAVIYEKVIPRLLRPLQTGGRSTKPSLCNGDLWHGNVGVDVATDDPILCDPCAIYAHNECECSTTCWRGDQIATAYHKLIKPSEPVEDYDDRNALYALYVSRRV
ncbi:hypothetical protein DL98DRAFT_549325 [Cadophora sp. DSE1049]|nr:hypothetical protein DL98DRAFT_549325 [Cadophora sp. DSE1049]